MNKTDADFLKHSCEAFDTAVESEQAKLLALLNAITDSRGIFVIFPFVFFSNKMLAIAVANTLHRLFTAIPIEQLPMFDEAMRRGDCRYFYVSQERLESLTTLNVDRSVCNSLYAIICSHHDGYIRERAVRALLPGFLENNITILLIRLNDWVSNIRNFVANTVMTLISHQGARYFLNCLCLLSMIRKKQRVHSTEVIEVIENALLGDCYDTLLVMVVSSNEKLRRPAFALAARAVEKLPQLIRVSCRSNDVIIKHRLLALVNGVYSGEALFDFIRQLMRDKSPVIRRACVYTMMAIFSEKSPAVLKELLFDVSCKVRELAVFYLQRLGVSDIKDYYKKSLLNKTVAAPISIIGLAEVGNAQDFTLIAPSLHDPDPRVRAACIQAVFKLQPDNKQEIILAQLPSDNPMILKAIFFGLRKFSHDYDVDAIEKVLLPKDRGYAKKSWINVKIASMKDKWNLMGYLLTGIDQSTDENITAFLEHKIVSWMAGNSPNKMFTRPDQVLLHSIISKAHKLIEKNKSADLCDKLHALLELFVDA